jgi:hypothetical protein
LTKSDTPELGGFERSYDLRVYVRTALFTGRLPTTDDAVRYRAKGLKIVSIREAPDNVALELELKGERGG